MKRVLSYLSACLREPRRLGDAELLAAFASRGDSDAFAVLVRRHGPMVYGVCRRWLRTPADVEDAFQATFLVLVQRAATIHRPRQLANWLHGVARHVARRQRQRAQREQCQPHLEIAVSMPEPDFDLGPLLDDEIGRLPEHYRAAIVLCHLQGLSRKQAAEQLGCPEGTLSAWLSRALLRLRRRLIRRGVMPAVATVTALTPSVADALPPGLLRATVAAAAVPASSLPVTVLVLTRGVLRMMMMKRLSAASMLIAVLIACGAGTALLGRSLVHGPALMAQQPGSKQSQHGDFTASVNGFEMGGDFMWLNRVEYQIPVKANDQRYIVPFLDSGTVGATLSIQIQATDDGKAIRELVIVEGRDRLTANSTAALGRYLNRVRLDKAAPQRISVVAPPTLLFARVQEVVDACRSAGFARIEIEAGKSSPRSTNSDPLSSKDKMDPQQIVSIQLKNVAAADTAKVIQDLFNGTEAAFGSKGRASEIRITFDDRTNTIFAQASPLDLLTIRRLLDFLDQDPAADRDPLKAAPQAAVAGKASPKLDGIWKGETGEWAIVGDQLVMQFGNHLQTARLVVSQHDGDNHIEIAMGPDMIRRGVYSVNGKRLTVHLLVRITPSGIEKAVGTLIFDRQPLPAKNADPFAASEKD